MTHQMAAQLDTELTVDALLRPAALAAMLHSQVNAAASVAGALTEIDAAAGVVAEALQRGSTLCYAAAGSSGLMALSDASELSGTFRIPQSQIRICMAGGVPVDAYMPGDTEDDTDEARLAAEKMYAGDVAIIISASGTTPYALTFARIARERGAKVIGIANAEGSMLLELADIAIALATGPEIVAGSTRLGAGTAQKIALNMISTQVGILLGHVHDGMMVNLNPENIKLRKRAVDIVRKISGVGQAHAETALELSGYDTKQAVLIAAGSEPQAAVTLLELHAGRLRDCLVQIKETTT